MMDIQQAQAFCSSVSRTFGGLFSSLPNDISFRKNEKEVYFLSNTQLGNSLFSFNIDDRSARMVLNPDKQQKLSRSEQLLRERMRQTSTGITFYQYIESIDSLLVDTGTNCCLIPAGQDDENVLSYPCKEGAVDYKVCPEDSQVLGCVSDGDIWLLSPKLSEPLQLTETSGERPSRKVTAGQSSFILQEEFDRYSGYWWSPNSGRDGVFRILYEEVDETSVEIVKTFNPGTQELDTYSYPRPGSLNAVSTLKMVSFEILNGQVTKKVTQILPKLIQDYFKEWEYIVRVGWTDDGENIWFLLMNREQSKSQILLISSKVFEGGADISTPVILWEESSETWINYYDVDYLKFLPPSDKFATRLLIKSEKTGFPHIVLIEGNLPPLHPLLDSFKPIKADLEHRYVTEGEWSVLSDEIWVDDDNNLVFFKGNKSSVLDSHLYVTSLDAPGKDPIQLTPDGLYYSSISMNTRLKLFVANCSNQTTPPFVAVFSVDTTSLTAHHIFNLHDPAELPGSYSAPTNFTTVAATGETLYGLVYPPLNAEEGKKYPTVVYVYGGPAIQLVTNGFSPSIHKVSQWTHSGFAVVVVDNRGSAKRGMKFESHIKGMMGSVEVDDQVAGLKAAANTVPYINLERVGICGWSYGGYMSLLALAKTNHFKVAIAGAPVTDWLWYDTGYTERYLGVPSAVDKSAYEKSSVIPVVKGFPNGTGRLLIIHGMNDENVFFTHTSLLVDSLVKHGKPYQLQIYNGERHGLRTPCARRHCDATVLAFLLTNL